MGEHYINQLNAVWHNLILEIQKELSAPEHVVISGLTTMDISIIHIVAENPMIMLKEICEQLSLAKSTLTSAINRLEIKGIILRHSSPFDKRAYLLSLTKKGELIEEKHILFEQIVLKRLLEKLNESEKTKLIHLLNKAIGDGKNE